MVIKTYLEPTLEPISLSELEVHLGISSGTISSDMTPYVSLPAGSYSIDYELLTLDVAPATAWAVGDLITGQTSSRTCIVVTVLTTKTFIVKSRSGAFTLGEIVGVTGTAGKLADQGATFPTFTTVLWGGYLVVGEWVEVLGHTAIVYLRPINNGTGGTVDAKIQQYDGGTGLITDFIPAFTQITESNDTVIQELQYTGASKYIRVAARPLVAASSFSSDIMVWEPNVSEDSMLLELITAGRLSVENDTSRKIMEQTIDYYPKYWPDGDRIKLPYGCLKSITAISYTDCSGTVTTLTPTTDYTAELNGDQCGFAILPYQGVWPSATLHPSNPICIRYVCGHATQSAVPISVKQAIKRWCVNNYMNRGDDVIGQTVSRDVTYARLVNMCGRLNDMDFL